MYDTLQHRHVGRLRAGLTVRVRLGYAVRSIQLLCDPQPVSLTYAGASHAAVLVTGTDITGTTADDPSPLLVVQFVAVPDQSIMVLAR